MSHDPDKPITIRPMCAEDADQVRRVDATAFGAWWRQLTGEDTELPPRKRANMLSCWEKDPEGCFVAEAGDRVVGFILSRTWGGVGWFGTFAILPEYQGRGIGKRLIAASLAYLRQDPERVIGLETMPESPYNLGLYLRQGFQARFPTFTLTKSLNQPATDTLDLPRWSSGDAATQERWLAELREATGRITPRLDYTKEIVTTARRKQGKTLVLSAGARAIGLSTVWLSASREEQGEDRASLQVLAMHPAYTDEGTFRTLLGATEALASTHGKQELVMSVNGRHAWALEQLLKSGYRVVGVRVRMVLKGTDVVSSTDNHVNLSRWAG